MRFRLFRMSLQGWVATADLVLVGSALLVRRLSFRDGVLNLDRVTPGELALVRVVDLAIAVLTFPVAWVGELFLPLSEPGLAAFVFVPLNACFWGFLVARSCRLLRRRWRKPSSE